MKLIQSYVEEKYFISTIYRQSSAITESPMWYYETMVWEWDKDSRQRKSEILQQIDSGSEKSQALKSHLEICSTFLSI
jgi:hypothetical protein